MENSLKASASTNRKFDFFLQSYNSSSLILWIFEHNLLAHPVLYINTIITSLTRGFLTFDYLYIYFIDK